MFNDRFLRACRCEPVDRTPVWFMRQAGRYQAEYRAIREKYSLVEICQRPELCAEVTRLPVKQLGVDAAILFADILLPLAPMGFGFHFAKGEGPVIESPIRAPADAARLRPLAPAEDLAYVLKAIGYLKDELDVPLIGFCGAPFTLASYLIEGGPSRAFERTKLFMHGEPEAWHRLMDHLTQAMATYLMAQAEAGASALQVFDSWVGCLGPADYQTYVLPHMSRLFEALEGTGVPLLHFGVMTGGLLELQQMAGGHVIGVDWRVALGEAWKRLGRGTAIQGNLDPVLLLGAWEGVAAGAERVLRQAGGRPGHVFNLGHGVLPKTDPTQLRRLVEFVHERSANASIGEEEHAND